MFTTQYVYVHSKSIYLGLFLIVFINWHSAIILKDLQWIFLLSNLISWLFGFMNFDMSTPFSSLNYKFEILKLFFFVRKLHIWTFVCRQAFLSFYEEIGIKKLMMLMILQAVDSFWFCVFHLIMMQITAEIQSTFYIMKITVQAFIMIPSLCSLYNTNTNAKKHSVTRNCSDLSLFE